MIRMLLTYFLLFYIPVLIGQDLYSDHEIIHIHLEFSNPNYWQQLEQNKESKIDIPATMIVNGTETFDSVGVRFKGNSSYSMSNSKKPFNISMDEFIDGQKLWGEETLNLGNAFMDPTFVREKIAYDIARQVMPAGKVGYVRLTINDTDMGLYVNVEQVNKDFLDEWFSSDKGNLYKGDPHGTMEWMDSNPASLFKNFEKKTNESENDWSDLFDLVDLLNNSIDLEKELPDILNIDRTCWYFAMCDVLVNLDSYIYEGHNYFIYHDPASDQFHMILWDMNEAFGCFPPQGLTLKQLEHFPLVPASHHFQLPLVDRMLNIPTFKQRYLAHVRTLLNHEIHPDSLQKRIDALHDLIDLEVKSDQNKLYSYEYFKKNIHDPVVIQDNRTAPGLLELIQNRRNFLLQDPDVVQIAPKIISAQCLSENPKINTSVEFNALLDNPQPGTTVTLFYRFQDGIFLSETMMDNSLHSDQDANDGLFGCSVSLSEALEGTCLEYYIQAQNEEGVVQFFPERAEFELLSIILAGNADLPDLVINEFMAANDAAFADPQGDYDDWIEIYNRSTESFSLKGLYLTDNLGNLKKWAFPDTVLHGQDYLIIWADKDEDDFPGLHCSFKLDKSREVIALIDQDENDNQIINACIFDTQETDHSMARIPNGEGNFIITDMVTPLAANTTETQVNRKRQLLSRNFRLDQNYPNPFNNQTRITFQVRTAENVKIELYNLQGQYMRTLTDGLYSPGFHHIQLDANGLASSIYIYILHTENGFQKKRKMVLVK